MDAMMKHLVWKFWFAGRRFLKPGLYFNSRRIIPIRFVREDVELVQFPEVNVTYAKERPEYRPLPAHRQSDGTMTCCWKLTFWQRVRILFTGRLWHCVMTFNKPLQPQLLLVTKPEMEK